MMLVLCVAVLFLGASVQVGKGTKRPFWNIAHMINDVAHFDEVLAYGANAIEADVSYKLTGEPESFYHGVPCDLLRWCTDMNEIPPYLEEVRNRTTPGHTKYNPALALMLFDNKLGDVDVGYFKKAGRLFARHMLKLYSTPSKVKVIVSIPEISQKKFFLGFRKEILDKKPELIKNFGYEFSWERSTPMTKVKAAFESVGVVEPYIWLSNGISNAIATSINFDNQIQSRDDPSQRFASKVYGWTADKESTLTAWIARGLDGIITNYPSELQYILKGFFKTHRLATQDDNPFEWIQTPLSPPPFYRYYGCAYHSGWARFYCWKSCPGSIGYCWINSYCGYDDNVCYQDKPCYIDSEENQCKA